MTTRFDILSVALALPVLVALVHFEGKISQEVVRPADFSFLSDTTCPDVRPEAEGVLDRFLMSTGYEVAFSEYGLISTDTSEVVVVSDSSSCAALDSTVAQVLMDSILVFEPSLYDRSYFSTDSFYLAVDLFRVPDSTLTPPPGTGIGGYTLVAATGIILFGKDYSFKRGFPF